MAKSFIQKLLKQYRDTDVLGPKQRTQQTPSKLTEDHLAVRRQLVAEPPDATLEKLRARLGAKSEFQVSCSTVDRALQQLELTVNKRRSLPMTRPLRGASGSG